MVRGLKSSIFQELNAKLNIYVIKTKGKAWYDINRRC